MVADRVARLMADILGLDDAAAAAATVRSAASEWDSVSHLRLVLAIEEEFGISISDAEVVAIESMGDIVRILERESSHGRGADASE